MRHPQLSEKIQKDAIIKYYQKKLEMGEQIIQNNLEYLLDGDEAVKETEMPGHKERERIVVKKSMQTPLAPR